MFKKDDVLVFTDKAINEGYRKLHPNKDWIVQEDVKEGKETVWVKRSDDPNISRRFYLFRMQYKQVVFAPGCVVKITNEKCPYISVNFGGEYIVEAVDGERLKLKGISNKLNKKFFTIVNKVAAPAPKKEEVPAHEKRLQEFAARVADNPGVCSFYTYRDKQVTDTIGGPCHARLGYARAGVEEIGLNFSGHAKQMKDEEGYKRFLKYILNDSPFAPMFLDKDADKVIKSGARMDVEKNALWVYTSAIATRHYTEFPDMRKVFNEVMDLGFDGNVAYLVSTFVRRKGDGVVFANFGGAHHVLNGSSNAEDVFKTFGSGFRRNAEVGAYKAAPRGNGVHDTMGKTNSAASIAKFFEKLFEKGKEKKDGWIAMKVLEDKNALNFVCIQVMRQLIKAAQ